MFKRNNYKKEINKKLQKVTILTLMGAIFATSSITASANHTVQIIDKNDVKKITTDKTEPAEILDQAGIQVTDDDLILIEKENPELIKIRIRRAFPVTLKINNKEQVFMMPEGSCVKDLISRSGLEIKEHDEISLSEDTILEPDMEVKLKKFFNVELCIADETKKLIISEGKVEESLKNSGYEIDESFIWYTDKDSEVYEGMKIRAGRETFREFTYQESIPYKTITTNSDKIYKGETKISIKGENGVREVVGKQRFLNGEIQESQETSDKVIKEPVNEIILVGTKEKPAPTPPPPPASSKKPKLAAKTYSSSINSKPASAKPQVNNSGKTFIDNTGKTVNFSSIMTGTCTAYTEAPGSAGAITSTGKHAAYGLVAVNPKVIPYGTKMYICSPDGSVVYGYAIAADTGGALMANKILVDLYYNSEKECNNFGRRPMNVYILD